MAPPVRQNGTTLTGSSSASAIVTLPASIAAGDVVVVYLYKENTNAVTPPAGFAEKTGTGVPATTTAPQGHYVLWKRMAGGETGTVTFSWTGSVFRAAAAERYSGCIATGDPIELIAGTSSNTSVTTLNVSLTGTSADTLLVYSATNFAGGNTWTPPGTYTERADIDVVTVADKSNAAGGNTGNVTATANVSGAMTSVLLSLLPDTGTAVTSFPQRSMRGGGRRARFRQYQPKHRQVLFAPPPATAAGPITVNPATETDDAQPVGRVKSKAIGTAVETDTAQTFGTRHARLVGIATETDAAVTLPRTKNRAVGVTTETDAAQALGRRKTKLLGVNAETDEAIQITRLVPALGIATETDTAQPFGRRKVKALGVVVETDAAVTVGRQRKRLAGIATETDAAVVLRVGKGHTLGVAAETDTPRPVGRRKTRAVGVSDETDTAVTILPPVKFGTAQAATQPVPVAAAATSTTAQSTNTIAAVPSSSAASMTVPTATGA